jgi:hypothetical protein
VGYRTRQRESNEVPLIIIRRCGSWLPLLQAAGFLGNQKFGNLGFWEKFPIPHRIALNSHSNSLPRSIPPHGHRRASDKLMGVHLMGVYLMSVHLTGVYLMGMHPINMHLRGVCFMCVHLIGMHLVG